MTSTRPLLEFIAAGDYRVMRRVHRWPAPRWVRLWMVAATRGGDGWLWYTLGTLLLQFGGPERFAALGAGALAAGAGVALFIKLKRLAGRRRPCAIEPHCWATLLPPDQFSFPSGHTIAAFAVSVSIGLFYPGILAGLLLVAMSVAVSRILLGMHFLSDVIAGAMLGTMLGFATFELLH